MSALGTILVPDRFDDGDLAVRLVGASFAQPCVTVERVWPDGSDTLVGALHPDDALALARALTDAAWAARAAEPSEREPAETAGAPQAASSVGTVTGEARS